MNKLRVRLAPSPGRQLHIGVARTALFNFLHAQRNNGRFLIRIEDSAQPAHPAEIASLFESLEWLGLRWSNTPLLQSEGHDLHRGAALRLLHEKKAYRCFCPPSLVERKRNLAAETGRPGLYDRTCLNIPAEESLDRAASGEPFCIRLQIPPGETIVDDFIEGRHIFPHDEIEDFVLIRHDGSPAYQLSSVYDDMELGITVVIRGDDHFGNTARQVILHQALENPPPAFAHLPTILGDDGRRLGKHHGPTTVEACREAGLLPGGVIEYLARLGYSPEQARSPLTLTDLAREFSFERMSREKPVFRFGELLEINRRHIAIADPDRLLSEIQSHLETRNLWPDPTDRERRERLLKIVRLVRTSSPTLKDLAAAVTRLLNDDVEIDETTASQHLAVPGLRRRIQALSDALALIPEWTVPAIEETARRVAGEAHQPFKEFSQQALVALTGKPVDLRLAEVLEALDRTAVLTRLKRLVESLLLDAPSRIA